MPSYESYIETVEKVHRLLVDNMLYTIVEHGFEEDRGHGLRQTLPGKNEEYNFEEQQFEATVFPNERKIENPTYDNITLTVSNLATEPEQFKGIVTDLYSLWEDTFGKFVKGRVQPDHPGELQLSKEDFHDIFDDLQDQCEILSADPTVRDFTEVITDRNYRLAAKFLKEDKEDLLTPGGHELSGLFTNGPVHVIYEDVEIALLKPEYDHNLRREVRNDQLPGFQRVSFIGEPPEPGYIIGKDDTPIGLFGHVIDATELDYNQEVSRQQIHEAMGFDESISPTDNTLEMEVGERLRLQGDLAIEKISETCEWEPTSRLNLPIDNHLALMSHATVENEEAKQQVPVRVKVPEHSVLNILHDEHEQVNIDVTPGEYEFYLLSRGLFPAGERPRWPESTGETELNA